MISFVLNSIFLATVLFGSIATAADPTPEQCLKSFTENYVPEYNGPNDYIFSDDKKVIAGALDVIRSNGFAEWLNQYAKMNLLLADAVGVVFNYDDEVHMIFASINVVNDKCQVKEVADINTVDIAPSKDKTLLAKYFLGIAKSKLPKAVREWLYDDVKNRLADIVE